MHITTTKLKTILKDSGLIDDDELVLAEEESKRFGQSVVDVLLAREVFSEKAFDEVVESAFGIPVVNLKTKKIPQEILEKIPKDFAKTKHVILFDFDDKKKLAKVAMLDPLNFNTIEYLRFFLGASIEPYLTTSDSFAYCLKLYRRAIGDNFKEVIAQSSEELLSLPIEQSMERMAESVSVVTILNSIVEQAVEMNASDIHFEPTEEYVLVRFRIDGVLDEVVRVNKQIEPVLVARVKILSGLQIDEHHAPQDGRFRFELDSGSEIDIRVNVMSVLHGEKVEMRLLKSSSHHLTLSEVGLSEAAEQIIREEVKKPHGMVLVTGPTGHGKTTTLYALLYILNTSKVNITTIEDPIEYEIPFVNQTQVNARAGVTFANGLRALLRQNPDIIMVGEIRDKDTVEISLQAALTGHLVLSSLHTNDAPGALPRLLDMGAAPFLISSTVNMVIAQRLVRKICQSCPESYDMPKSVQQLIVKQIEQLGDGHVKSIPKRAYRGKGCSVCGHSGFQGQIGLFEVFRMSDALRALTLKPATASELRAQAVKEGMETMFEDGLKKVAQGITTIEEVLRVVRE